MAGRNSNVDKRIVRMTFDNKQFEKNVSTSMSTIDKLKKALKLEDAAKGFDEIDKAAKSIDFSHLTNGIQEVHNKFSFLDIATIKVFDRIADSALNLGKKIVNALAVEPITTGFQEYETKMNSIQVIAANTGALNQDAAESAKSMAEELGAAIDIWTKGNWGNGQARKEALTAAGLDPVYVQEQVNKLASGVATSMDDLAEDVEGSSGTTIGHIEDVLDELNLYADKTIYNFTQMTQAIGQFTTAGVDVDTSATAVKGIANLAAYVGAPAADASRSMFQLSQALSTGRVRLQDWMSLEHTAGMGGKTFQNELIKTAEHLREVNEEYAMSVPSAQEAIEAEGSFRESLRHDWLTTDVLSETLAKFSGSFGETYWKELGYSDEDVAEIMNLGQVATDAATKVRTFTQMWDALKEAAQSGWTETWQYIVGGFEDAPVLWTAVNNAITSIIDPINDARNEVLKFWSESGGRSAWFKATTETVEVVDELGNKVAKLDENGEALVDSEGNIVYETEQVSHYSGILANIWETLGQIIEPIKQALQDVFPDDFGKILVKFSKRLERITESIRDAKKPTDKIYSTFKGLFTLFRIGLKVIGSVAKIFGHIVSAIFPPLTSGFLDVTGSMGDVVSAASSIETAFEFIDGVVAKVTKGIDWLVDGITNMISILIDTIKETTGVDFSEIVDLDSFMAKVKETFDFVLDWIKNTTGIDFGGMFSFAIEQAKSLWEVLKDIGNLSLDNVKNFFIDLKDSFTTGDTIKEKFEKAWATVTGFVDYLVGEASTKLNEKFGPVIDSISETISNLGFKDLKNAASIGVAIAAIVKLIQFIKNVSGLAKSANDIKESLIGILDGVADAIDAFKKSIQVNTIFKLALAIGVLVAAIIVLSFLPEEQINHALEMIVVLFTALIASLKSLDAVLSNGNFGSIGGMGFAFVGIAAAIGVMTLALLALSFIPEEKLGKSVAALGFMFAYIGALIKAMRGYSFDGVLKLALAIVMTAIAVDMLIPAVVIFSTMPLPQLIQGVIALGVIMGMIGGLIALLGEMSKTMTTGKVAALAVPIMAVAVAIDVLVAAVYLLGSMDPTTLWSGVGAVGALGFILTALMGVMSTIGAIPLKNVLSISILIGVVVGAIWALTGVVWLLGSMDSEKLTQGIDAFQKIANAIEVILGIVAAIVIIGQIIKKLSFGGGVGGGLSSLAANFIVVAAAMFLVAGAVWLVVDAMTKFWALIEKISKNGGETLKNFATQLAEGIPILAAILVTHIPEIAATILQGILAVLTEINAYMPQIIHQIGVFIIDLIAGLSIIIVDIVGTLIAFLTDLMNELTRNIAPLVDACIVFIIELIHAVANALIEHSDELVVALIELLAGIGTLVLEVFKAIWGMWEESDAYKALEDFGGRVYDFVMGIRDNVSRAINVVKGWFVKTFIRIKVFVRKNVNHIKSVIEDTWNGFVEAGKNIVEAIKEGIMWAWENSLAGKIVEFAQNLIAKFTGSEGIDAHSPSRVFIEIGKYIPQGLAKGIDQFSGIAEDAVGDLSSSVIDNFGDPMSIIAGILDGDMDFEPVIAPVMDMSNVYSGMGVINGMFGRRSLGLATVNGTLNAEAIKLRDQRNQNSIYSDANVISTINGLREDVTSLKGSMSGMKVVMDTGALVGATVGPMDGALGRRAQRTKRGG